eukprot:s6567_g1.t1
MCRWNQQAAHVSKPARSDAVFRWTAQKVQATSLVSKLQALRRRQGLVPRRRQTAARASSTRCCGRSARPSTSDSEEGTRVFLIDLLCCPSDPSSEEVEVLVEPPTVSRLSSTVDGPLAENWCHCQDPGKGPFVEQNRATRDGATWYRGRWLTRQQLQAANGRTLRAKAARPAAQSNAHKHARTLGRLAAWPPEPSVATGCTFRKGSHQLSVFSLNIGSFTTEVYDEFCRWLELPSTLASIDVIFIQETWRGSSDYQLPGWSWIASGQKPLAGQGVAVLVNRQLADPAALRFREVRVGRILHVQVPLRNDSQGRLLNLPCVYIPAKISESKQVYEKRAAVWNALDAVLQALPSRHVLCVAGDFNTDLLQDPPLVGTTYLHKGKARTAAQDQPLFQNLLRNHGLHALNTWSNQGTYADPHGPTSRVDFLLTRTLQAAGHRVAAQPQVRFASWRAGARHLPLLGLIDLKVWCRFRDRTPVLPPIDQEALCTAGNGAGDASTGLSGTPASFHGRASALSGGG